MHTLHLMVGTLTNLSMSTYSQQLHDRDPAAYLCAQPSMHERPPHSTLHCTARRPAVAPTLTLTLTLTLTT